MLLTQHDLQNSIACMGTFIGLHGVSGVGKDTLASTLVEEFHTPEQPLVHAKMALALRALVYHTHDLDPDHMMDKDYEHEHGVTQLMIDTAKSYESRSVFFGDILMWGVRCAMRQVHLHRPCGVMGVVLSDIRQHDEADLVKKHGALVHLTRDGVEREEQALDQLLSGHDCTYTMHLSTARTCQALDRYNRANSANLLELCAHDILSKMPYVVAHREDASNLNEQRMHLISYTHQQVRMLNPHLFE